MAHLISTIKSLPFFKNLKEKLDNQYARDFFVINELKKITPGKIILDAGCGNQRYKKYCSHLSYRAQDFGKYTKDTKKTLGTDGSGGETGYEYGQIDYIGDIWNIHEQDHTFDAVLCTEVFEHIPYPIDTLKELSRVLKTDGKLILTLPSNCLRHMDPYFYYTGFSDRWLEKFLSDSGFSIDKITPVGDYFSWLSVEIARIALSGSIFTKIILTPAFIYLFNKKRTQESIDTLCMGYHIVATKTA